MLTEFDLFWQRYPRKVAKLDALKAYTGARKMASAADILAGVERYLIGKAAYADWCHPATFLRSGRWMDEADTPVVVDRQFWGDICQARHGGSCASRWDHEMKMREQAS